MPPARFKSSDSRGALKAGRLVRGGILYLLGTAAVLVVGYIFGLRSLEKYGTGFLYGGLFMVVFGLFMAGGNSLPFQLPGTRRAAGESGMKREDTGDGTGAARRGAAFFLATLVAGILLGITGFLLRLPWRG